MRIQAVTPQKTTRVFAMASDEDGIGKTSVVANMAFALTKLQKNCLRHGYWLWSGKSQYSSTFDPAISRGRDSVPEVASGRPAVVGNDWISRPPLWRYPSSHTGTASSATAENRRRHISNAKPAGCSSNEPWRFVHCHNHLAERSEAILLAAAVSLKDKPWEH